MIEQGIAKLVQGTAAVAAIAKAGGGFLMQLPKGQLDLAPTWTLSIITDRTNYSFDGPVDLGNTTVQIDVFANDAASVIGLARAIDKVLSGYKGTLADSDSVSINGCFQTDKKDFFDAAGRTFRRMLEYQIFHN